MTPVVAIIPYHGHALKAPLNTRNSPTNPLNSGKPTDYSMIIRKMVEYTGIGVARPPYSLIS